MPHVAGHAPVDAMRRLRTRRRPAKPPRPFPIRPIELAYREQIIAVLRLMRQAVEETLLPRLPSIERQVPNVRRDQDWSEAVDAAMGGARERFAQLVRLRTQHRELKDVYREAATRAARQTAQKNLESTRRQIRSAFGVDVFAGDVGLSAQLGAFAAENVSLITSIPDRYFREVEGIVMRNFRSGRRAESFEGEIQDRFSVSESRAALIARDQVNKLNGELTEARQTQLGIEEYIWRTSLDERVRPSHAEKEGKKFRWDEPPADTGHPGEDIQCRCSAEPVLE